MGGVLAAIGAQLGCPDEDAIDQWRWRFSMMMCELASAAFLPIKFIIIDNRYLGMVRQWQQLFCENRLSGVDLEGNPDFVKIGEAYGIKGFYVKRLDELQSTIKSALEYNEGPVIVHAEVVRQDNVFPMIPAGGTVDDMLLEHPVEANRKPKGVL